MSSYLEIEDALRVIDRYGFHPYWSLRSGLSSGGRDGSHAGSVALRGPVAHLGVGSDDGDHRWAIATILLLLGATRKIGCTQGNCSRARRLLFGTLMPYPESVFEK